MKSSGGNKAFVSPRELKTKTQNKAYKLLNKEEIKAKKGRLECLLIQQFISKYGAKTSSIQSMIQELIKKTVHEFMSSHDDILVAENNIGELEKLIIEKVSNIKGRITSANTSAASAREDSRKVRIMSRVQSGEQKKPGDDINKNEWPVINAILAVSEEKQKSKEQQIKTHNKLKYQEELRTQIEKNKYRMEIENRNKTEALEMNRAVQQSYQNDLQNLSKKKEQDFRNERSMRLGQIEENKIARERERQLKIDQEKAEMLRSKNRALDEENEKLMRKERDRENQERLFIENERNKEVKRQNLQKKHEYEKKLNSDWEAKMEKEENARLKQQKDRLEALSEAAKKTMMDTHVSKDERAGMNQREIQRIQAIEREDFEREKNKQDKRRNDLMSSTKYNLQMADKKKMEKDKERMDDLDRRARMQREQEEDARKEENKLRERKMKMVEMKKHLDKQVNTRHASERGERSLTELEVTFNKSILKKMNEDETLANQVVGRVQPTPLRYAGGRTGNNNIF